MVHCRAEKPMIFQSKGDGKPKQPPTDMATPFAKIIPFKWLALGESSRIAGERGAE